MPRPDRRWLGGDEFAVLLEPIESQLDAVALAERIAMYAAKVQGKGRYVAFQPTMRMGIAAPAV